MVSIQTNVHQLLSQIEAKNGLQHKYQVPGKDGIPKTEGALNEGDFLKVTDKYGKLLKVYHIKLKPFAVAGKLRLVKSEITINTKTDFNALFYCRPTKS